MPASSLCRTRAVAAAPGSTAFNWREFPGYQWQERVRDLLDSQKGRRERWGDNRMASVWAEECYQENFHCHRGAFYYQDGIRVTFGNDGYRDSRVKAEINLLKSGSVGTV